MATDAERHLWAQKITSLEKFNEVYNETDETLETSIEGLLVGNSTTEGITVFGDLEHVDKKQTWWLRREIMREQVGVYAEPTSVLRTLRTRPLGFGVFWPHVSKDDPTMVAYTPDATAGINDKQVKVTLGRLLRRWFPTAPDHVISRIEATHRAEMDPHFPIARTPEEVERVYRNMEGDSGCMRHSGSYFDLSSAHPSHVYTDLGFGVAYQERNGQIVSRSVIWDNPDDPTDKRYVRIYGDQVIRRKLERAGYRLSGLAGAKMPIIKDNSWDGREEYDNWFVLPYVDPAGGIHSNNPDNGTSQGIWMHGENFIRLLGDTDVHRYREAGAQTFSLRTQNGKVAAVRVRADLFAFTDLLTGLQYSRLDTGAMHYVHDDGRTGEVAIGSLPPEEATHVLTVAVEGKGLVNHHCSMTTFAKWRAEEHGMGERCYNNEATLRAHGLARLDVDMYPGHALESLSATRKVYRSLELALAGTTAIPGVGPDMVVPRGEVVQVHVNGTDELSLHSFLLHISCTPELKKAGYLAVGVINNIRQLAHKTHPKLATTVSGRRVVIGVHDVRKLVDGRYDFERNSMQVSMFGAAVWVSRDESWTNHTLTPDWFKDQTVCLDTEAYELDRRKANMLRSMSGKIGGYTVAQYVDDAGDVQAVTHYARPARYEQLVAGAKRVLAAHEANAELFFADTSLPKFTLFWARNVLALEAAFDECNRAYFEELAAVATAAHAANAAQQAELAEVDQAIDEAMTALGEPAADWVPEAEALPPMTQPVRAAPLNPSAAWPMRYAPVVEVANAQTVVRITNV